MNCTTDAWYALQVRPGQEWQVQQFLVHKEYETFAPTVISRRRWVDRTKEVERPLFPGYVFCQFSSARRSGVVVTPGVKRVVGYGLTPVPIAESEIGALRSATAAGLFTQPHPYLATGQQVRVIAGPLRNVEGLVTGRKSDCELIVSITLLQRSVAIQIDRSWIEPAEPSRQSRESLHGTGWQPVATSA